jgi:hypothetical protein
MMYLDKYKDLESIEYQSAKQKALHCNDCLLSDKK